MRVDNGVLGFIERVIKRHFQDVISDISYSEIEDYGFDMTFTDFSGNTYPVEVKSSISHPLKIDGSWNEFFSTKSNGLFRTADFRENILDTYAYVINADCKSGGKMVEHHPNCKWEKLMNTPNSILIYVSTDGMVTWTQNQLRKAHICYLYLKCRHTNQFRDRSINNELKAVVSLEGGNYYKFSKEESDEIRNIFKR